MWNQKLMLKMTSTPQPQQVFFYILSRCFRRKHDRRSWFKQSNVHKLGAVLVGMGMEQNILKKMFGR